MRVYFACSIQGGRQDAQYYQQITELIKELGHVVLTDGIGSDDKMQQVDAGKTPQNIFEGCKLCIQRADVVIAEVTQPSHGVGYEVGYAEQLGKPVICLYRPLPNRRVSAMILGNKQFKKISYTVVADLRTPLICELNLVVATE